MKTTRLLLQVVLIAVPMAAAAMSGGPIQGQVLDDETGAPIAGAMVVVEWSGSVFLLATTTSICPHVEVAISDSNGVFKTPRWSSTWKLGDLVRTIDAVNFEAYKPGYVRPSVHPWNLGTPVYLKKFKGAQKDYFAYLNSVTGKACGHDDGSISKLVQLIDAVYAEAKALAQTPEELRIAQLISNRRERILARD